MIGQRIASANANETPDISARACGYALRRNFASADLGGGADLSGGVSIAATLSTVLFNVNQSGTGDIATFQGAGTSVVRIPDQGGVVVVPQAGGFRVITGLVGYDNTAIGFPTAEIQHEGATPGVPVDPQWILQRTGIMTTYP